MPGIAFLSAALFLPICLFAQAIAEPTIPADRLELSTGDARPVTEVSQRAAAIQLLRGALHQSNVRTYPYDLTTRFRTTGTTSSDGSWRLRDTSPGAGAYRWAAEGPSYSAVNLFRDGVLYSNQPVSIPLRLAQVRSVIFFKNVALGPRASIRTFTANLDGAELACLLIAHNVKAKDEKSGARRWDEMEYCVDPASQNLITYSPAAGMYVRFDYSQAIHFQDKIIPGGFVLTQGGQTIIEGRIESLLAPPTEESFYQPNGLNTIGVGSMMTPPWRINTMAPTKVATSNSGSDVVVLHAIRLPDGKITDAEIITATNPAFNSDALSFIESWNFPQIEEGGATPETSEVFFTVHFGALSARPLVSSK